MKKYITGDLLHYKICNAKYLIEVTNTSKYGYCFKGVKDDFNGVICDEFIEDIPLTPEILEKNGWKLSHGFYWSPNEEGAGIGLSSQNGYVWNSYLGRQPLRSNINSVSDLQHLLFGLGLNSEIEV